MDRSTDPGRAPECFEFDSSDKTSTVVTLREGFRLETLVDVGGTPEMARVGAGIIKDTAGELTFGNGSILQADDIQIVTASAMVGANTRTVLVNTANAVTLTVPASLAVGKEIGIMRTVASANAITVACSGSETIEGATTFITHGAQAASTGNYAEVVLKKISATAWMFVRGEVSGSNSDGSWVKYGDGTMQQRGTLTYSSAVARYTNITKTLPIAFVDSNYTVICQLYADTGVYSVINWSRPSSSSQYIFQETALEAVNLTATTKQYYYYAIGRWK